MQTGDGQTFKREVNGRWDPKHDLTPETIRHCAVIGKWFEDRKPTERAEQYCAVIGEPELVV